MPTAQHSLLLREGGGAKSEEGRKDHEAELSIRGIQEERHGAKSKNLEVQLEVMEPLGDGVTGATMWPGSVVVESLGATMWPGSVVVESLGATTWPGFVMVGARYKGFTDCTDKRSP